jgi:hypothetical protein
MNLGLRFEFRAERLSHFGQIGGGRNGDFRLGAAHRISLAAAAQNATMISRAMFGVSCQNPNDVTVTRQSCV